MDVPVKEQSLNTEENNHTEGDSYRKEVEQIDNQTKRDGPWVKKASIQATNNLTQAKKKSFSAELLISIPNGVGSKKNTTYLALVDTGSSSFLALEKVLGSRSRKKKTTDATTWSTQAGSFETKEKVEVERVRLPQFTTKQTFSANFYLFKEKENNHYSFILRQDILQDIGIDILNSSKVFKWDDIEVDFVPCGHWNASKIAHFWGHSTPTDS